MPSFSGKLLHMDYVMAVFMSPLWVFQPYMGVEERDQEKN